MQRSIPTGRGLRSGPICDLLNTGERAARRSLRAAAPAKARSPHVRKEQSMTTLIGITREEVGILRADLDLLVKAMLRRCPQTSAGIIAQTFGITERAARRSIVRVKGKEAMA